MGRYELMPQKPLDKLVSHLEEVSKPLTKRADAVGVKAEDNLTAARSSTTHHKISGPEHETRIDVSHGEVDHYISMSGSNPMAIEYGHVPSGYFAEEKYGRITKAPAGLYILTNAGIEEGMEGSGKHNVPVGLPNERGFIEGRQLGKG